MYGSITAPRLEFLCTIVFEKERKRKKERAPGKTV